MAVHHLRQRVVVQPMVAGVHCYGCRRVRLAMLGLQASHARVAGWARPL